MLKGRCRCRSDSPLEFVLQGRFVTEISPIFFASVSQLSQLFVCVVMSLTVFADYFHRIGFRSQLFLNRLSIIIGIIIISVRHG